MTIPYKTDALSIKPDYIIVGGGLCGCVLASRVSEAKQSVLLIEAGPDEHDNPIVQSPLGPPLLHNSQFVYNWRSATTDQLERPKPATVWAEKFSSGSSSVNYGLWTRGHSVDYDEWAALVGDRRWSYEGLLRYFIKSEHCQRPIVDPRLHGLGGPMKTVYRKREFPLSMSVQGMYESIGLKLNVDANDGDPLGYGPFTENWYNGSRQPAGVAYNMSRVTVLTNTPVRRIHFQHGSTKRATSVETVHGRIYTASKEIIVTCGAIKTPQLLMLSGIGPREKN